MLAPCERVANILSPRQTVRFCVRERGFHALLAKSLFLFQTAWISLLVHSVIRRPYIGQLSVRHDVFAPVARRVLVDFLSRHGINAAHAA